MAFALRLLCGRRQVMATGAPAARSLLAAYATAVTFSLGNPMLLVLLVASIASVVGPVAPAGCRGMLLLAGVGAGSAGWWVGLTGVTSLLRHRLSPQVLTAVNTLAGLAMAGFGILACARVLLNG